MQEQAQMQEIPVKVYRAEERVTIAAPMPGLEPQDIHVEVTEAGSLMLHGDLRGTLKGEKDVLLDEWTPGPYHREVDLEDPVDGESANVTYNNGVVVVVLPFSEQTRAAELELETVSSTQGVRVGNRGKDAGAA
jgi:HSP20 family protein